MEISRVEALSRELVESPVGQPTKREQMISYYEGAGPDYFAWSRNYNMHFGYYAKGMNPFFLEPMLERLTLEVLRRLDVNDLADCRIADFGCGLGASLRYCAKEFPNSTLQGVTIVPWQVDQGNLICSSKGFGTRITITEADYTRTMIPSNSLNGVFAIESGCYATGGAKSDLLREIYRVLQFGGKFVMADGFLKHGAPLSGLLKVAYNKLCNSWALSELGNIEQVKDCINGLGFKELTVEEISLNIAPSVAHVPFRVFSFLAKEFFFGKRKMTKERWDNLKSPLLTMVLGLARENFGYYLVSARK
ncbi:MAG TPA: methyltransferase domain-containing protein [Chryseolinea sp.]